MSQFRFLRKYVGKVQACILDWSGTTADKYVIAPAVAFVEVFQKYNVPISMHEARGPMGLRKDLHIKALTEMSEIKSRWREVYKRDPTQEDVDNMFKDFVPMQLDVIRNYSKLIPETPEAINRLRKEFGCKIGVTTGFLRCMADVLVEEATKQGFTPDVNVAGDDVLNGARPKPFMLYKNLDLLDVHPIQSVVKVDDTISGIGEALEAGCWGVGVARYSNYMNIDSFEQEKNLSDDEIAERVAYTKTLLRNAGAHYVVDSIGNLPEVVADINTRLARGESP